MTIRKIGELDNGGRIVEIYENLGRGRDGQDVIKHKYDVLVTKIPAAKAAAWSIEELMEGEEKECAKAELTRILEVARDGFVWLVTFDNRDCDLFPYQEFHGSRESAMKIATEQTV